MNTDVMINIVKIIFQLQREVCIWNIIQQRFVPYAHIHRNEYENIAIGNAACGIKAMLKSKITDRCNL